MASPVDIVNQAAQQMGARARCTSINPSDGSPLGDAASLLYQTQFEAVARAAHWNCLRAQIALTVLKARLGTPENPSGALPQPPYPWLYEYAKPDDCLAGRFVIPLPSAQAAVSPPLTTGPVNTWTPNLAITSMPFVPGVDFNTQAPPARIPVILTNAIRADYVYTANVDDPDLWDPSFKNAFIAVLAAWLVNPLNMKASLLQERVAVAKELIMAARLSDGNEGVTPNDHIPDWIQARWRRGDLGVGAYANGPYLAGWSSITLPGGISF